MTKSNKMKNLIYTPLEKENNYFTETIFVQFCEPKKYRIIIYERYHDKKIQYLDKDNVELNDKDTSCLLFSFITNNALTNDLN